MGGERMKVYYNGETYAVVQDPPMKLVLVSKTITGHEDFSKAFYSEYALYCYIKEHNYKQIA